MTVLAFAVLLVGVDAAQTRWFRLIYWAAVTFANITSVYIVTGGRDLVIGIVVSEFVMYIVYMAATGEIPNEFFENIYDLTIIKDQFGTSGIIARFAVFVVFSAAVIIPSIKLMKKETKPTSFVLGMYDIVPEDVLC